MDSEGGLSTVGIFENALITRWDDPSLKGDGIY